MIWKNQRNELLMGNVGYVGDLNSLKYVVSYNLLRWQWWWWLEVDSRFWMLVTNDQKHWPKTVVHILKISPTHFVSNIRHPLRCNPFSPLKLICVNLSTNGLLDCENIHDYLVYTGLTNTRIFFLAMPVYLIFGSERHKVKMLSKALKDSFKSQKSFWDLVAFIRIRRWSFSYENGEL